MKPLADGYLYRSVEDAIRYALGVGAEVAVCGTNTVQHVRQVAAAVRKGPADGALRETILRKAVDLIDRVPAGFVKGPVDLRAAVEYQQIVIRQLPGRGRHEPG